MSADGYLTIAKIGRNQHLIPEATPRFVVKEPVVVLFLRARRFGDWWNLTTGIEKFNEIIEYGGAVLAAPIYGMTEGPQAEQGVLLGGIAVFERHVLAERTKLIEEWEGEDYSEIYGVPYEEHRVAWEKITSGLWVPSIYVGTGESASWHLPKDVEVLEEVHWHCWT